MRNQIKSRLPGFGNLLRNKSIHRRRHIKAIGMINRRAVAVIWHGVGVACLAGEEKFQAGGGTSVGNFRNH